MHRMAIEMLFQSSGGHVSVAPDHLCHGRRWPALPGVGACSSQVSDAIYWDAFGRSGHRYVQQRFPLILNLLDGLEHFQPNV